LNNTRGYLALKKWNFKMTPDQITFGLRDLATGIIWILTVIFFVVRIRRITKNDFGGFIKRKEFKCLEKEVREIGKTVAVLDERTEKQGKEIGKLSEKINRK